MRAMWRWRGAAALCACLLACLPGLMAPAANLYADDGAAAAATRSGPGSFVAPYRYDPISFDYLRVWRRDASPHIANFVDGLLEHDRFGILGPALAIAWSRNDDATEWTFSIRPGVWWMDSGRARRAEVTSRDWVDAMRYLLESASPMADIARSLVFNADAYARGALSDFGEVGVKAQDRFTLRYRLERPTPWFDRLVCTQAFLPVYGEFLAQAGRSFGKPGPDGILYNGAYILDTMEPRALIRYSANEGYWDREHVGVDTATYLYDAGDDPEALARGFESGLYSTIPLGSGARAPLDLRILHAPQDASTFMVSFNFLRARGADSAGDAADRATAFALGDRSFRKALFHGIDRAAVLDAMYGPGASALLLRNTLTAPGLVADRRGSDYALLVESALKARNPGEFGPEFRIADGQDPYHRPDRARLYFERARKAFPAGSAFPVELEAVVPESDLRARAGLDALAASLARSLGADAVRLSIRTMQEPAAAAATGGVPWGARQAFDIGIHYGWKAEYSDPSSCLRALPPGGASAAARAVGLSEFRRQVEAADQFNADETRRLRALAAAEAQLIDDALLLPLQSLGSAPHMTRVMPYGTPYARYGLDDYKLKGMRLDEVPLDSAAQKSARAAWDRERAAAWRALNSGNRSRR